MTDVIVPNVGESVSSGILTSWLKQEGEFVQEGENLFELETDKATMEVPATVAGVIHIKVEAGVEVEIGSLVATLDESLGESSAKTSTKGAEQTSSSDTEKTSPGQKTRQKETRNQEPLPRAGVAPPRTGAPASNSAPASTRTLDDLSPAVRRLVEELALNPADIAASDPSGRLTKEDVQNYVKSMQVQQKPATATLSRTSPLHQNAPKSEKSKQDLGPRQERVAMTNLRKRIAERLVHGKQTSAHLSTFNEVDMKAVIDIRKVYKERFEKKHGVRLGFMSFFLKAAVKALQQYPEVNAFVDGTDIVHNYFYDISVALSSDRGLITPVLRNVDQMSFADIELTILDFSKRAQVKKIMPDELMGGTFTISNGGVFGSMLSTPIPNPPQTAILGMHSIQEKAVVLGGEIVIRPMMYLALTYDHRVLDGREAIGFLKTIKEGIEDPNSLLLDT